MAVVPVTPANAAARINAALVGDVIEFGAGRYSGVPKRSGLTYRAFDYTDPFKAINGESGHLGQGFAVICTDIMGGSHMDADFEGIFFDLSGRTGNIFTPMTGDRTRYRGCVATDRPGNTTDRRILFTVGLYPNRFEGFEWDNGRVFRQGKASENRDHPFYLAFTTAPKIRNSILQDAGHFGLHCYIDCDDGDFANLVIWGGGRCVTFSGDNPGNNGSISYAGHADRNVLRDSIIGACRGGYAVEKYAGGGEQPVGNRVVNTFITSFGGAGGTVQPGMLGQEVESSCTVTNVDPGFVNPSRGDFRLKSGAAAAGRGLILDGSIPPPPPPPSGDPVPTTVPTAPTGLTVTPGDGYLDAACTPNASGQRVDYYVFYVNGLWDGTQSPTPARRLTLPNGTAVPVRVSAHNAVGHGPWSAPVVGTPAAPPPDPDPDPTDPCADVRDDLVEMTGLRDAALAAKAAAEEARDQAVALKAAAESARDAAVAGQAAAEGKLATVRADVAAETQRHGAAIADALD